MNTKLLASTYTGTISYVTLLHSFTCFIAAYIRLTRDEQSILQHTCCSVIELTFIARKEQCNITMPKKQKLYSFHPFCLYIIIRKALSNTSTLPVVKVRTDQDIYLLLTHVTIIIQNYNEKYKTQYNTNFTTGVR